MLASRADGERGAKAAGTVFVRGPSLSADGGLVAFAADATNLAKDDTDTITDVFVRDLATHETILVSRASGRAGAKADDDAAAPVLSGDGRFVAFTSTATNLTADPQSGNQAYVRDLQTGTTTLESRAPGAAGAPPAAGVRGPVAVSGDGRFVAFATRTRLLTDDRNRRADIYLRDRVSGKTFLASRPSGDHRVSGDSGRPSLSADGHTVAFESAAALDPADGNGSIDVYVRDVAADSTTLISRTAGGVAGDAPSRAPAISADGRRVAYQTAATNLSADDVDGVADVLVQDLGVRGAALLVSRTPGATGPGGNGSSGGATISADGRFVAFGSRATILSLADPDVDTDVYVRELPPRRFLLPGAVATAAAPRAGDRAKVARFLRGRRFSTFRSAAGDPPSSIERHYDFCPRGRVRYESTFLNTQLEEPAIDIRTGTWRVGRAQLTNGFGTARIRLVSDTGERGAILIEASPRGFRIGGEIAEVTRSPVCGRG